MLFLNGMWVSILGVCQKKMEADLERFLTISSRLRLKMWAYVFGPNGIKLYEYISTRTHTHL